MKRLKLRIGKVMEEKNMSAARLSDAAGVSLITARQLAGGYQSQVVLNTLNKVADALNVSPIELFEVVE